MPPSARYFPGPANGSAHFARTVTLIAILVLCKCYCAAQANGEPSSPPRIPSNAARTVVRTTDDAKNVNPGVKNLVFDGTGPAEVEAFADFEQLQTVCIMNHEVTAADFQALAASKSILALHCEYPATYLPKNLSGLEKLVTLEEVVFKDSLFLDGALSALTHLPKLKTLRLLNATPSEEDWQCVAQVSQLTTLDCSGTSPQDEQEWLALVALKKLQTFIASDTSIRSSDLSLLKDWTALTTLDLGLTLIDNTCLPHLMAARSLKRLSLASCYLMDGASLDFARLDHLANLDLTGVTPTTKTIETMHGLKDLRVLNLSSTLMSVDAVAALVKLQALQSLRLAHCKLKDAAPLLKVVGSLQHLVRLDVTTNACVDPAFVSSLVKLERKWIELNVSRNEHLTGASLTELQVVKSLQTLGLADLRMLDDAVLTALTALPRLEEIDLRGSSKVSDKAIAMFAGMQHLKVLWLKRAEGFSDEAITQLKKHRPDMTVHLE